MEIDKTASNESLNENSDTFAEIPKVPETPDNANKRKIEKAFTPEDKEKRATLKLNSASENDDELCEGNTDRLPVTQISSKMGDLKDKHSGIKPFRDYQEYNETRESIKDAKCSVYEYTMETLNKKLSELTTVTPTYRDILVREMLEPTAINRVRNTFCTVVSSSITESHLAKKPVDVRDSALKIEIRQKVFEAIVFHFKQDAWKHRAQAMGQAPSETSQEAVTNQIASLAADKVRDEVDSFVSENGKLWYIDTIATDEHRDIRLDTIVSLQPHKADAGVIAKAALERVYRELSQLNNCYPTEGQLKEHVIKDYLGAEAKARETSNTEQSVTALKVQTALLTTAVAEVNSKEDDRKLRIRNIESVLTTKVASGDRNSIRDSKDKRECELITWIDGLVQAEHKFSPKFTVFIIEPKSAKQKATAILTLALESDKFRMEKIIKKARGEDRSKPVSYTHLRAHET